MNFKLKINLWYSIFKDIKFWIPIIISLIALAISVLPYFQQPEIHGRITRFYICGGRVLPYIDYDYDGTIKKIEGTEYVIRVLFTVLNKNFIIKDFNVYIKYK